MDPPRPPPIATHSTKRKFVEDEAELSPHLARVTLTTQASQTSLPSIYELQPDLPPPGPRHAQFSGDPRFPPLPSFPSTSVAESSNTWIPSRDEPPSAFSPEQAQLEIGDSDGDGDDALRRPKQKRRRQALSCTECKRRKIKCDRAHPCGPCTRRNDQHKCQWHVIEPVDKYVSRAEHEQLKTRLATVESRCDKLEAMLASLTGPPPFVQSPRPFDMAPVHGALRPIPPGPSGSFSLPFTDVHPPAPSFHTSASAPSRDEDYSLLRHGPEQPIPSLRIMTSPVPPFHHLSVPQHSRPDVPSYSSQPFDARSPEVGNLASTSRVYDRSPPSSFSFRPDATTKPSPLSLSSIITPYNTTPASQSKNSSAQTLTPLSERLRSRPHPQDSAAHSPPPDGCRNPHSLRPLLHAFTPAVIPA
ncbi:uncharacterized protein STEHIDRAFT_139316 [Stereum hirsutum FP-91666 SS1]|uniref:uncharacterized protein n=1 Tax=Stereum hirsutum (strain FP-91666) TaxID=721885 RepID=UPI000440BED7|nr:uncharacterized protein STEHIDRAFT_139316 [Stereum hirsutum FP-91666 SS1]EIM86402.1 hypothetical protein STEHIDRAFT_139316 [Stereum hirsutum FP-91666 SS1]